MIKSNRVFAEELYDFLKANDESGHFENTPAEQCIAELEDYLSDLHRVRETISDIEEISDTFDTHEFYVDTVKPLLYSLREIESELEAESRRRMVGDTNYEVKNAFRVGAKEIVFAEDRSERCWPSKLKTVSPRRRNRKYFRAMSAGAAWPTPLTRISPRGRTNTPN